jgi:hypothetical protein
VTCGENNVPQYPKVSFVRYASDIPLVDIDWLQSLSYRLLEESLPPEEFAQAYEHSFRTQEMLRNWTQPEWIQATALLRGLQTLPAKSEERKKIFDQIGARANRVCALGRNPTVGQAIARFFGSPNISLNELVDITKPIGDSANGIKHYQDICSLILIESASEAARSNDIIGPFRGLRELARGCLALRTTWPFPWPLSALIDHEISEDQERACNEKYAEGHRWLASKREKQRALAEFNSLVTMCSWIPEPLIYVGCIALLDGDIRLACEQFSSAKNILAQLGTSWDKSISYLEWMWLITELQKDPIESRRRILRLKQDWSPQELLDFLR